MIINMTRIKCVIPIVIILLASVAFAEPDLQVYNLEYSRGTGRIVATIYNQAENPVNDKIIVNFYDNDLFYGSYEYLNGLPRYSTVSVYLNYNLDENDHRIKVIVDPDDSIYESRELNNERTILVEGKKIDMTPVVISTTPSALEFPTIQRDSIISYVIILIILAALVLAYTRILKKKRLLPKREHVEHKEHEERKEREERKEKKKESKTFFDE